VARGRCGKRQERSSPSSRRRNGELDKLPKKEALHLSRELLKLQTRLGGLREMRRLPKALFVVDTHHETNAIREATILQIPVIAMCDTNSDPDPIAYPIPANDDAIRAIKLIAAKIADAVIEGKNIRGVLVAEAEEAGAVVTPEPELPADLPAVAIDAEEFEAEEIAEEMKKSIFKEFDAVTRSDAVLASNTLSLAVTEMVSVTRRPDKV